MPALKVRRYFTGLAAEITATIFPVKRRQHHYFSGKTPLTLLFFQLNAVNAAILPVKRH